MSYATETVGDRIEGWYNDRTGSRAYQQCHPRTSRSFDRTLNKFLRKHKQTGKRAFGRTTAA